MGKGRERREENEGRKREGGRRGEEKWKREILRERRVKEV